MDGHHVVVIGLTDDLEHWDFTVALASRAFQVVSFCCCKSKSGKRIDASTLSYTRAGDETPAMGCTLFSR